MNVLTDGSSDINPLFVCLRDKKTGAFSTNFHQAVSIDPSISFHTPNRAVEVLHTVALNILAIVFPSGEVEMPMGRCSTVAVSLHRVFADEVLSTMPEEGGNLPYGVVRTWAQEISINMTIAATKISA